MREIPEARMEVFEDLAMEGAKQLSAYFKYEGDNPRYYQRGRLAVGAISSFSRLYASQTNRAALDMAAGKMLPAAVKQIVGKR